MGPSPVCRKCNQPMKLLDEEAERWYCYKDEEVYFAKTNKWGDSTRVYVSGQAREIHAWGGAAIGGFIVTTYILIYQYFQWLPSPLVFSVVFVTIFLLCCIIYSRRDKIRSKLTKER